MKFHVRSTAATLAVIGLAFATAAPAMAGAADPTTGTAGAYGADNTAGSVAAGPSVAVVAAAPDVAPQSTHPFPSTSSTIIASIGVIDADEVGWFYSVSRGDSVTESFNCPNRVRKAIVNLDVVRNVLSDEAFVDWTLSINGKDVGSFTVNQGQVGPVTHKFDFRTITTGGDCLVKLRVTNEVAGGHGSHTLAYAGTSQHELRLKRR